MFKPIIYRLGNWLAAKAAPRGLTGNAWTGTGFVDGFKRNRNPTANELMAELKATAWTCASINAAVSRAVQTGRGTSGPVWRKPAARAAAIVKATTFYDDPDVLAKVSRGLGEAMVGINVEDIAQPHRLAERGW